MQLKALAIAMLVPPISLVFLALFGLLAQFRWRRIGAAMAWLGALGLLALAMPVVAVTLLVALEDNLPLKPPVDQPPQAIVILGGDIQRGTAQLPLLQVGPLSLERVRGGAQLARRTGLPVLISGGRLWEGDPPVALVMADSMQQDFQVPVRWVEQQSRDTWENAQMSAAILREHGIRSIYLVTHAWHIRRALVAFANTGLTVTAAPMRFDREPRFRLLNFVPDVNAWRTSYFAMHEWIGCVWYALR